MERKVKMRIIIGIIIGILVIILLFRTNIVNNINLLKCKNIDGSLPLTNFDYELEYIINVTGNNENQNIKFDKLLVYEENKKMIYSPNNGKKASFFVLGDKYYRLNKTKNLEGTDLDIIKKYLKNKKQTLKKYYKKEDEIIVDRKENSYVEVDTKNADELVNILNKVSNNH